MSCVAPLLALADDDEAIAPPQVAGQVFVDDARDGSAEKHETAPNLRDELRTDDDSAVDVRSYKRKDGAVMTEYSVNGQVFRIKVQPNGGLPAYYLERNSDGQFERHLTGRSTRVTPPSWILQEF